MKFRNLSDSEIGVLKTGGCRCDEWSRVKVAGGFDPSRCTNVTFSGDIKLGEFIKTFTDDSGVSYAEAGYQMPIFIIVIVGSNVLIGNIGDYIANYIIEDDVVIKNCGKIHTQGKSTFGNGTEVAVLNETGGRSVRIWDRLSAHEAYIIALYRHRDKAISKIEEMVREYSESVSSSYGNNRQNCKDS